MSLGRRRPARPGRAAMLVCATPLVLVALALWRRRHNARRSPGGRPVRAADPAPIDIVAVVDDLLLATR